MFHCISEGALSTGTGAAEETANEARGPGAGVTGDVIIMTLSHSGAAAWLYGRAIISSNERPTTNLFGIGACRSRIPTGTPA
jgi:hypothetical protein